MSKSPSPTTAPNSASAAYLDMPVERRVAAMAHAATLSVSMRKLAAEIKFTADVDDFRRVLSAGNT